jgi:ABC-2 type transport system permease protein
VSVVESRFCGERQGWGLPCSRPRLAVWLGRFADVVADSGGGVYGLRLHGTATDALLAFALCLAYGFAFQWVFLCIGLASSSGQGAQGLSMLAYPVMFVSSAYVRVSTLPSWMRPVADHQPITIMCNAVRSLALGNPALAGLGDTTSYWVLPSLVWAAGITLVFAPLAAILYRRSS